MCNIRTIPVELPARELSGYVHYVVLCSNLLASATEIIQASPGP
jgi:hypothetical protein